MREIFSECLQCGEFKCGGGCPFSIVGHMGQQLTFMGVDYATAVIWNLIVIYTDAVDATDVTDVFQCACLQEYVPDFPPGDGPVGNVNQ